MVAKAGAIELMKVHADGRMGNAPQFWAFKT